MTIKANPGCTRVTCPKLVVEAAWLSDAEHFNGLTVVVYHGAVRKRARILAQIRDMHPGDQAKVFMKLADSCQRVILMTGPPSAKGPDASWAQLRMIDPSPGGLADDPQMRYGRPSFTRWADDWLIERRRFMPSVGKEIIEGYTLRPDREEPSAPRSEFADARFARPATLHAVVALLRRSSVGARR